jgi:hypothetical protein
MPARGRSWTAAGCPCRCGSRKWEPGRPCQSASSVPPMRGGGAPAPAATGTRRAVLHGAGGVRLTGGHREVTTLIAMLRGLEPGDARFQAAFTELREGVEEHVGREEGERVPASWPPSAGNWSGSAASWKRARGSSWPARPNTGSARQCTPCNAFPRKPSMDTVDIHLVAKPRLPASLT